MRAPGWPSCRQRRQRAVPVSPPCSGRRSAERSGPIFGLLSAFSWGTGDFAGGLISRFSSVFVAIMASEAVGLAIALVLALVTGEPVASVDSVGWAALPGWPESLVLAASTTPCRAARWASLRRCPR